MIFTCEPKPFQVSEFSFFLWWFVGSSLASLFVFSSNHFAAGPDNGGRSCSHGAEDACVNVHFIIISR